MKIKKPAVDKHVLILISGVLWSIIGVMLITIASRWLSPMESSQVITEGVLGSITGIVVAWFGLRRIAEKNISRILAYPSKVCLFAFQEWKSYFMIMLMMGIEMSLSAWFSDSYCFVWLSTTTGIAHKNSLINIK